MTAVNSTSELTFMMKVLTAWLAIATCQELQGYNECSVSFAALQRIPRVTRICVIGAHGVGKTTLVTALNEMYPGHFQVITEVARQASC